MQTHEKLQYLFAMMISFPGILIGFNSSLYIFPFLVIYLYKNTRGQRRYFTLEVIPILFFALGCYLSIDNMIYNRFSQESIDRSMEVLFNYYYWLILILFLIYQKNDLNISIISKGLFHGILVSIVYYFFLLKIGIRAIPIFNNMTQNSFSFLLITYSPVIVGYLVKRNVRQAVIFSMIFVLAAFLSGSRAGSLLVLLGCSAVLALYSNIFSKNILILIIGSSIVFIMFLSGILEIIVYNLNPRTHELLFNRESVVEYDRSYLTRLAMINKGLSLFRSSPYYGIGLNNFVATEGYIEDDFVGAKYVIHKKSIQQTSSHNSYINILAELGLWGFIPFVTLLALPLLKTLFYIKKIRAFFPFLISYICMCSHLYVITAIINVYAWFMIGLYMVVINRDADY